MRKRCAHQHETHIAEEFELYRGQCTYAATLKSWWTAYGFANGILTDWMSTSFGPIHRTDIIDMVSPNGHERRVELVEFKVHRVRPGENFRLRPEIPVPVWKSLPAQLLFQAMCTRMPKKTPKTKATSQPKPKAPKTVYKPVKAATTDIPGTSW